jgi:membrane protein implicated in regulation of membrane protease activity
MTWSDFYLICFFLGLGLSALAVLASSVHLHIPHLHLHHGIHLPHGGSGARGETPWFNFGTLSAFLAWFGGTGYVLEHTYHVWVVVVIFVATLSGLGAAAVVFWFVAKVLMADEVPLDPADYDMVGVLGKTTISIRPGGTGELVFTQGGTRHVAGARSEDGAAIPKGTEVMVTRYDKGIAYVRPFADALGEEESRVWKDEDNTHPEEKRSTL